MATVEQQVHDLARWWNRETGCESSTTRILDHPGYKAIVQLGEPAIPTILTMLGEEEGGFIFAALEEITGVETGIADKDAGRIDRCEEWWLEWGVSNGYI